MEWADRVARRVKLRDLNILLAVAQCGRHGESGGAARHIASGHLENHLGIRAYARRAPS